MNDTSQKTLFTSELKNSILEMQSEEEIDKFFSYWSSELSANVSLFKLVCI